MSLNFLAFAKSICEDSRNATRRCIYTHLSHADSSKYMRSKHRLGPIYFFLLGEVHRQTRARTYVWNDVACVYPRNPVTVSHTGPMYDSCRQGGGTGTRYRRNLKVKLPEIFGEEQRPWWARRRERRDDEEQGYENERRALVALMQVHRDTGDPVTNSPTFCPIMNSVPPCNVSCRLSFINLTVKICVSANILGSRFLIFEVSNFSANCIANFINS